MKSIKEKKWKKKKSSPQFEYTNVCERTVVCIM